MSLLLCISGFIDIIKSLQNPCKVYVMHTSLSVLILLLHSFSFQLHWSKSSRKNKKRWYFFCIEISLLETQSSISSNTQFYLCFFFFLTQL